MSEHLRKVAQTQIDRHLADAAQQFEAADRLVEAAEWNLKRAEGWQEYIAGLGHVALTSTVALELIPEQRKPERHLKLVEEV